LIYLVHLECASQCSRGVRPLKKKKRPDETIRDRCGVCVFVCVVCIVRCVYVYVVYVVCCVLCVCVCVCVCVRSTVAQASLQGRGKINGCSYLMVHQPLVAAKPLFRFGALDHRDLPIQVA